MQLLHYKSLSITDIQYNNHEAQELPHQYFAELVLQSKSANSRFDNNEGSSLFILNSTSYLFTL